MSATGLAAPPEMAGLADPNPRVPAFGQVRILTAARLQAYGYAVVTTYAAMLMLFLWHRGWITDLRSLPIYNDFTCDFVAGLLALHGKVAAIYLPQEFVQAQYALVGAHPYVAPIWPYPPIFLLILAPLAALPYAAAFLTWAGATLFGSVVVVWRIVRQRPAIPLTIASPFAALNFLGGQSGALTGLLIGASLLTLERRPVLAGTLVGCLGYKPQFAILFPVALAGARQWRAFAAAAAAATLLAVLSAAIFGASAWLEFPQKLAAQAQMNLVVGPGPDGEIALWGLVQTVYGLVRRLGGGAVPASLIQGATTLGLAATIWLLWRSQTRYPLKAAALSAAALVATPYGFSYSLCAAAIPVAFLAKDQIENGVLRGEEGILIGLAAASFLVLASWGTAPIGGAIMLVLLGMILRRVRVAGLPFVPTQ